MSKDHSQSLMSRINGGDKLGKSLKVFPIRNQKTKRWLRLTLALLLILGSISSVVFLSIQAWETLYAHSWAIFITKLPLIIFLLVIVLPSSIMLFFWVNRHWNDSIIVFEHGLLQKLGKKTKSCLWCDVDQLDTRVVDSVFGGSSLKSKVEISMRAKKHLHLKIKQNYDNIIELAQMIRKSTLPVLYQKLLPEIVNKEPNIFNKNLVLNQSEIVFHHKSLNLKEFAAIKTHQGNLTISAMGQNIDAIKIPLKKIKNLDLLLFILHNPWLQDNLPTKSPL